MLGAALEVRRRLREEAYVLPQRDENGPSGCDPLPRRSRIQGVVTGTTIIEA